ncbi:MAG TPA: Holliday junction branch migration protein RuvA [Longimicrobiales bacterium]|nr:Holliday junction branch migration protein RuvA [Longimicrobiales bacterium]
MIARLQGILLARDGNRVEIETKGGVVYEVLVPLTVLQRLPQAGDLVELRTVQVVSESALTLYGFLSPHERTLFQRLLTATGVGAKLALAMMSTFPAERLARALIDKDTVALRQVKGVGKKTAEKMAVELSDRVADLAIVSISPRREVTAVQEAVQALVSLGYTFGDADKAVRRALEEGPAESTEELIRRALDG